MALQRVEEESAIGGSRNTSASQPDWPLTFTRLAIRRTGSGPVCEQILQVLRSAITSGELPPGTMFPTSREFALALGIGRSTIARVYGQLAAEGHIVSNTRRGTRVAPQAYTSAPPSFSARRPSHASAGSEKLVDFGFNARQLLSEDKYASLAFTPHEPDALLYPRHLLGKMIAEEFRHPPDSGQRNPFSRANLRLQHALARYLRMMRGISCEPAQIIPTAGLAGAVDLTIRVMIDPGHNVHLENPTFKSVRDALRAAGANIFPLALPSQSYGESGPPVPPARMIFVSPSLNFPFGHQMPLAHRHALRALAASTNAIIFESDIGAELVYAGPRRQAIQGEDHGHRVIYYGSFSETLGPQIQMGYLIVPPNLVDAFAKMDYHCAVGPSQFVQSAIARFVEENRYAAHVKLIRARYAERAQKAVALCRNILPEVSVVEPAGGLQAVLLFSRPVDEAAICSVVGDALSLTPLSQFYLGMPEQSGLVLNFGMLSERALEAGVKVLANAIRLRNPLILSAGMHG